MTLLAPPAVRQKNVHEVAQEHLNTEATEGRDLTYDLCMAGVAVRSTSLALKTVSE